MKKNITTPQEIEEKLGIPFIRAVDFAEAANSYTEYETLPMATKESMRNYQNEYYKFYWKIKKYSGKLVLIAISNGSKYLPFHDDHTVFKKDVYGVSMDENITWLK